MIDNSGRGNSQKRTVHGSMKKGFGAMPPEIVHVPFPNSFNGLPHAHISTDPQEQDLFFKWGSRSKAPWQNQTRMTRHVSGQGYPDLRVGFSPGFSGWTTAPN